jgi:hypothetical protein
MATALSHQTVDAPRFGFFEAMENLACLFVDQLLDFDAVGRRVAFLLALFQPSPFFDESLRMLGLRPIGGRPLV